MAVLHSSATGNLTAAGSWKLVDPTSYLSTQAASTGLTTTFVASQNFVPGAITVDALSVYVAGRTASPTGTLELRLFNVTAGAAVAGTTVSINATDVSGAATSGGLGWLSLALAAPVTLNVGDSYNIQARVTTNGTVTLFRSATAGDWSRALRTTTNQAPVANDELHIQGDWTAPATQSTRSITQNDTGLVTYGKTEISKGGTITAPTAASSKYMLLGEFQVWADGNLTYGTSGTPIGAAFLAEIEFQNVSPVQFGIDVRAGGIFTSFGNALAFDRAKLAADASAGATSLTTDVSTGWLSGDRIALASTSRTAAEAEDKLLTANAVGTALTITALTNAHSGTAPTQGELANLTRNVRISSLSSVNTAYVNMLTNSIVSLQWTEFFNLGSATASKRGINVNTTTGSCLINRCSIHNFNPATNALGIFLNSATGNNITISNNVLYSTVGSCISTTATTGTAISITGNLAIRNTSASFNAIQLNCLRYTITNNTATSGAAGGFGLSDLTASNGLVMSGNTAHSNAGSGFVMANCTSQDGITMPTISSSTSWRNNSSGFSFSNSFNFLIDGLTAFGQLTANIIAASESAGIYFRNVTSTPGSLVCPVGISVSNDCHEIYVDSSSFGPGHTTGDVNCPATNVYSDVTFRNTSFLSTTQFANVGNLVNGSRLMVQRMNGVAGNHQTRKKFGILQTDTTIFNMTSPSTRITPNNATNKMTSAIKRVAVVNGTTARISVFLRKSVAGDGSAYNGNQPRLILRANPALGITTDTVLATADNTYNGVFKALTAVTPAITDNGVFYIYVDCDGTAGWINLDTWRVT